MILSKRGADHKPHDMIYELVDNAFDAYVKGVSIELERQE
jgi:DNA gyrase/topoisomerase IV subunit B